MEECIDEINDIIENRQVCMDFAKSLKIDMERFNENRQEYINKNRIFEVLSIDKGQKKRIRGTSLLYCYKYKKNGKNNKNVRCIFIIDDDSKVNVFLKCFVEKDKKDYRKPIEDAINRYNKIYLEQGGE